MKILHLTGEREDVGGILSVIRNLQTASQSNGWNHFVWVNRDFAQTRAPELNLRFSQHVCSELPNHWAILVRSARALLELRALLRRESFDIIHAHNRGTLLVARAWSGWTGRPVLFTNHGYARRTGLYRWAAAGRHFHTVLLTPNMARHYGLREEPPKVNIISACCDDAYFREALAVRHSRAPGEPIRFIGVGNIMRWKNWHLAAEAMALMASEDRRQIQFSVWGPTPDDGDSPKYGHEARAAIARHQLEDQIRFEGATMAVHDRLREADWFLLPSTNEPCSVALIEAMALGVPALVSASGGNIDIVNDRQTGLLFRPDDPFDLAEKLRSIVRREFTPRPPDEVRQSVVHRSASKVVLQYANVYRHISEMGSN